MPRVVLLARVLENPWHACFSHGHEAAQSHGNKEDHAGVWWCQRIPAV